MGCDEHLQSLDVIFKVISEIRGWQKNGFRTFTRN